MRSNTLESLACPIHNRIWSMDGAFFSPLTSRKTWRVANVCRVVLISSLGNPRRSWAAYTDLRSIFPIDFSSENLLCNSGYIKSSGPDSSYCLIHRSFIFELIGWSMVSACLARGFHIFQFEPIFKRCFLGLNCQMSFVSMPVYQWSSHSGLAHRGNSSQIGRKSDSWYIASLFPNDRLDGRLTPRVKSKFIMSSSISQRAKPPRMPSQLACVCAALPTSRLDQISRNFILVMSHTSGIPAALPKSRSTLATSRLYAGLECLCWMAINLADSCSQGCKDLGAIGAVSFGRPSNHFSKFDERRSLASFGFFVPAVIKTGLPEYINQIRQLPFFLAGKIFAFLESCSIKSFTCHPCCHLIKYSIIRGMLSVRLMALALLPHSSNFRKYTTNPTLALVNKGQKRNLELLQNNQIAAQIGSNSSAIFSFFLSLSLSPPLVTI
jgi:hypothetical protein